VHGELGLQAAERISLALFSGDISALTESDFAQLSLDGLPSTANHSESLGLVEVLVASELASSNKMAREFIANGAVSVNGEKISDPVSLLLKGQALFGRYWLVRRGKKQFHLYYKP
jgi:tyrosyl-tRNA synthetase